MQGRKPLPKSIKRSETVTSKVTEGTKRKIERVMRKYEWSESKAVDYLLKRGLKAEGVSA